MRRQVFCVLAGVTQKTTQFRHFLDLARLMQFIVHRQTSCRRDKGELTMTAFSNFAQHTFAAFAALTISVLLFANTLATQAAEVHSVAGILA